MMNKPGVTGLKRLINAAKYSIQGLKAAYRNEEAFRLEIYLLPIITVLAVCFSRTGLEFALLFSSYWLILIAELINSGIEAVVDRIGSENHPLSGQAKDIGSAIVMLAAILTVVTWLSVIVFR